MTVFVECNALTAEPTDSLGGRCGCFLEKGHIGKHICECGYPWAEFEGK